MAVLGQLDLHCIDDDFIDEKAPAGVEHLGRTIWVTDFPCKATDTRRYFGRHRTDVRNKLRNCKASASRKAKGMQPRLLGSISWL